MKMVSGGLRYVLLAIVTLMAVAKVHALDVSELKGRWVLEAVNGKSISIEGGEIYFQITDQTIIGYDGCNRFGMSIGQPSPGQRGQRACLSDAKPLPFDLANLMPLLGRATLSGDKLSLPLPDGKGEAVFRRSP